MPYIPRRKGRNNCGLMNGEAGIGVHHDQPSNIYRSETDNPLLVGRKFVLILYKYFEISRSLAFISAALK